jgi:hypothetical protein
MYDTLARTQLLRADLDERLREARQARGTHAHDVPRRRHLHYLFKRVRRSEPSVAPALPAQRPAPDRLAAPSPARTPVGAGRPGLAVVQQP